MKLNSQSTQVVKDEIKKKSITKNNKKNRVNLGNPLNS
jgi:hypothetical protein